MSYEKMSDKGLYCPAAWWFRLLFVLQLIVFAIVPDMRIYLFIAIPIFIIFELRSPSILVTDEGIKLLYYGIYNRFIYWDKISKVSIMYRYITIDDNSFPIPLFIQFWRRDYQKVKQVLSERFKYN